MEPLSQDATEKKSTDEFSLSSFPPRKILVAVDGSENSLRASKVAIAFAKENKAELIVLNVIAPASIVAFPAIGANSYPGLQSYYEEAEKNGVSIVENLVAVAKEAKLSVSGVVERSSMSIVQSIVDKASTEKVDLIVIGTRGLGGFKRLLLGSVSSGVTTHAHCNVLVVK
jgi:nucleotide-binding universal stress UspA family protein